MNKIIEENNKDYDEFFEELSKQMDKRGLGFFDGMSYGKKEFEAAFFVVNYDLAKQFVINYVRGTPFENFKRIYDQREE